MKWMERSFGGRTFRPAPVFHYEPALDMMAVATYWGPAGAAERTQNHLLEVIATMDSENRTHDPESFLRELADEIHNWIFENVNANGYQCVAEFLFLTRIDDRIHWLQIGEPALFIWRLDHGLVPLAAQTGQALFAKGTVSPLPKHFLGGSETPSAWLDWCQIQRGDRLLLLARNKVHTDFFANNSNQLELDELSQSLAQENSDEPFWISWIEL